MSELPEVTKEEVEAALTTLETVDKLRTYAEENSDDALDAERLDVIYKYVEGLQSTLAIIYKAQRN